jgi:hypothetical protein
MGDPFIAVLVARTARHKPLSRLVAALLAIVLVLVAGSGHIREADGKAPEAQTAPDVTIQVLGQNQSPQSLTGGSLVNPRAGVVTTLTFAASSWQGGWLRNNSGFLGRPWVAIYGAQSDYPRASLVFNLDDVPTGDVRLTLVGICDESGTRDRIRVTVNGLAIYTGTAWFRSWNGEGNGADAVWTTVLITLPADYFASGTNRITVANLQSGDNFSSPPYVDLGAARLDVSGVGASIVGRL